MKQVLFVTDTYYPDSSATTTLGRRTAETLAQLGHSVDVYPAEISGNHFCYPEEYNGVTIIVPQPHKLCTELVEAGEFFHTKDSLCEQRYVPVKAFEDHPISQKQVEELSRILHDKSYDCVFSVAIAFEVNFLVHQALRGLSSYYSLFTIHYSLPLWFPMAYDPYAFDPHVTPEQRLVRIGREIDALGAFSPINKEPHTQYATKVFFLTEFKEDYIGSPIEDKIEWFMLPCIAPSQSSPSSQAQAQSGTGRESPIEFDHSYINCVFLGDFYYGVENTDFIFRLFDKLTNNQTTKQQNHQTTKIRLYTVGNLCDFKPTVDLWKEKLGDRYICHERVSQEEAHNIMLDCDVLVSMGHDSPNMCPSKIIDFISSGKPILHIKKIPNCCGAKYLQRYPNKYSIYQGAPQPPKGESYNMHPTDKEVEDTKQFILSAKDKEIIPFSKVKELYSDFTMEALIGKILKEI